MLQEKYQQARLRDVLAWVVVQSVKRDGGSSQADVSSSPASAHFWCVILCFAVISLDSGIWCVKR